MKPINTSIFDFPGLVTGGYVYVDKEITTMKLTKTFAAAALTVTVAGLSFASVASVVGPTSASYAGRSDMIAQWDGIDNAGTGAHVAGATVWKDLVGSRDLVLGGMVLILK